jgi:two-component system, sensor histidine kinase
MAVVTGQQPVVQTSSSLVAVAASAGADDAQSTSAPPLTPGDTQQRVAQAAVRAVRDALRRLWATTALAIAALLGCQWWLGGVVSSVWIVAALAAAACGSAASVLRFDASQSPATRPLQRLWAGAVALMMVMLAAAPWAMPADAASVVPWLVAFIVTAAAIAGAVALTPLPALAAASAVLPLSAGLFEWLRGGVASAPLALVCVFGAVFVALVALLQHRAWHTAALAAIKQQQRVRALESARDAAMKADQEKSRFLAIASHDLRQPVHAIGLFAATLEKRLEGSAEEPLVRNLTQAIDGLDRSFNVMLDISRLDAGAIEPRVQHFPVRDLFRRLHMHFAGQAEQKNMALRFSPGGKSISSDPQLLERILGNLVQNALKYTERGGVVVVARSTTTHTHIEVWDTGIGICASDLPKVFDEFYQVGQGQRVRTQGLGMGLAIVKRLARLLGHELIVSSRPGCGTMFRLRIALGGLPDIQDVTAAADTLPMPILQARTVIVLDDEEAIREGLCLLLHEWGYEAVAAGTIAQAVHAVETLESPPDLILSDLHLGEGPDGIAGIEAIRRRCGFNVAAMLITGDTSHDEIRRATDSGHPVLFKPVQPRKLYDALRGLGS